MKLELYVITDEKISQGLTHQEIAIKAIEGGADVIQLRAKDIDGADLYRVAVDIRRTTRDTGTLFIVNDRLDIAMASQADGVHLGQGDMPLSAARRISPKGFIIGISVGNMEEAIAAEREGADYVALSPIFPTTSKDDAGPGGGLAVLRQIREAVRIPVIAIGGIDRNNVRDVLLAGADGIAVISAVVGQKDVVAAAKEMKGIITEAKQKR
jgi:thiamine-phosphate pyrophosphorylase